MAFIDANNVNTTLAASLASGATSMSVTSSANMPTISAGDTFTMTLNDAATGLVYEIVYATARSGAVLTIVRGQQGTTAQTWSAGDYAYHTLTAGEAAAFLQSGNEPGAGYAVLSPPTQQTGTLNVSGSINSGANLTSSGAVLSSGTNISAGAAGFAVGTLGVTTNAMAWSNSLGSGFYTLLGTGGGSVAGVVASLLQLQIEPAGEVLFAVDGSGNTGVGGTLQAGTGVIALGATSVAAGQVAMNSGSGAMYLDAYVSTGSAITIRSNVSTAIATITAGTGAYTALSDRRLKSEIKAIPYGVETVMALKPSSYTMIESGKAAIGFIAQEVQEIIPELVSVIDENDSILGLNYDGFAAVFARAIQQQEERLVAMTQAFAEYVASHP